MYNLCLNFKWLYAVTHDLIGFFSIIALYSYLLQFSDIQMQRTVVYDHNLRQCQQ